MLYVMGCLRILYAISHAVLRFTVHLSYLARTAIVFESPDADKGYNSAGLGSQIAERLSLC
jgi:hypothetical protein